MAVLQSFGVVREKRRDERGHTVSMEEDVRLEMLVLRKG